MEEAEFKEKLNIEQYRVMRKGESENPFSGKYWDHFEKGEYDCVACGNRLFASKDKLAVENGWPTFRKPIGPNAVLSDEVSSREEKVLCARCRSFVGRRVDGKYRIYSAALRFKEHDLLGTLEDVKDKVQDTSDALDQLSSNDQNASSSGIFSTISTYAQFLGGSVVGILVGAAAAFLICHATCTAPLSNIVPSVPLAGSSTPSSNITSPKRHTLSTSPRPISTSSAALPSGQGTPSSSTSTASASSTPSGTPVSATGI
ncbi:MAG: peptide-methionine (R)-S-oxide reductase [Patescibacteria group bacterium]|nr:peptide-methionine (R)-S-oxide reductase [Patescibacteria group bacterium]